MSAATTSAAQTRGTVSTDRRFDDAELAHITTFSEAADLLVGSGVEVESFDEYGNGFTVLPTNDKARLVGVPFVIVEWRFNDGDNGEFVTAHIVTDKDEKLIVNDGSTGIRDQLKSVTAQRESRKHKAPTKGLLVKTGLTRSDYDYIDPSTKKTSKATTYYLSN